MSILGKIFKSEDEQGEVAVDAVAPTPVKVAKKAKKTVSDDTATEDVVSAPVARTSDNAPGKRKQDPEAYKIISSPLITEKATDLMTLNKYVFAVPVSSNKAEVLKKIFSIYGVKPIKINLLTKKGKKVRHGKTKGRTSKFKKAIITLDPKDKIEVYEGV